MAIPERQTTAQGFEKHLGINHFSHFFLTSKLYPLLQKAAQKEGSARIVSVSSAAHLLGNGDNMKDDLMLTNKYEPWPAYGNSKLANVLFTKGLASRVQSRKDNIIALTCHPGACRTELGRYIFDPAQVSINPALYPLVAVVGAPAIYLTKSSAKGAQTQSFLAGSTTIDQRSNGLYFDNSKPASVLPAAVDTNLQDYLWEESIRVTGEKFLV